MTAFLEKYLSSQNDPISIVLIIRGMIFIYVYQQCNFDLDGP